MGDMAQKIYSFISDTSRPYDKHNAKERWSEYLEPVRRPSNEYVSEWCVAADNGLKNKTIPAHVQLTNSR